MQSKISSYPLFAIQVTEAWLLISYREKKLEMASRPYPPSSCCSSGCQRHWFTALMGTLLHQHNVLLIYGSHWAWFIYNFLGKKYERGWCVLVGEVCYELKPRNDKTRQTGQFEAFWLKRHPNWGVLHSEWNNGLLSRRLLFPFK